jgi:hypothetical protein
MHVRLNDQADVFRWNLHQNGQYTVKSLYLALINTGVTNMNKQLWKLKVPLKIKIFMWYLKKRWSSQKIILRGATGMAANNAASVCMMSLYNICFLSAGIQGFFGTSANCFWCITATKCTTHVCNLDISGWG